MGHEKVFHVFLIISSQGFDTGPIRKTGNGQPPFECDGTCGGTRRVLGDEKNEFPFSGKRTKKRATDPSRKPVKGVEIGPIARV